METYHRKSSKVGLHSGYLRLLYIAPLRFYRLFISPLLGPHCRFEPTCSSYAETALEQHGFLKGTALTLARLAKCHPWHSGGFDPVPEKQPEADSK